jgi:hypothetical protein
MNPRLRAILRALILVGVVIILFVIFPGALRFVEMAARELRYLWWLILLVALAVWLIWGFKKKP